ncbi:tyrosine-protein phosphatase [Hyphomicrobium sulfonivorans]|uniref:tyrosine-protein phosphatase n=1 Tax=Hyphomicrobium sulfonivorans TaxID=121290 RepID=UPI001570E1AC|nr:CpsB/CapC family capsule biosynthesis tyrosine phosphatase [Hyphomicrobium sulfonivorans]NSL72249.1 capsular biosynthesis protein [Hyphomicrobium sulfonivorans]
MIDLHSHLLPGIDDGAPDLDVALEMARAFVADGITVVACTPHILPGLYPNTGADILRRVEWLQSVLDYHAIPLRVVAGADNHMVPDFVAGLLSGHLLSLHNSRYVLVEPPHHNAPPRMEEFFFDLLAHGYVPVLTHPERLSWINQRYSAIEKLADAGVWMQITAGSVLGTFGRGARHWAERMLDEGRAHIFATDAHDVTKRPPQLSAALQMVADRVGRAEAENLFFVRPKGILLNEPPSALPMPVHRKPTNCATRANTTTTSRARGFWRIFQ